MGEVGKGNAHGVLAHVMVAVDADNGACLGLVGGSIYNRKGRVRVSHAKRALKDKESKRWGETAAAAGPLLSAAAMVTVVADRESDIYDLFAPPAGQRPVAVPLVVGPFAERRRPALQPLRRMG